MKTVQEILKSKGITLESKHHSYEYLYKSIIDSHKEYAMQEVKKHLEIAYARATFKTENIESNIVNTYRIKVIHKLRISVNKESITNIEIKLT